MAGIRVEKIPKEIQEKHLKIHFSKPVHGGSDVRQVYYPLTNNDAIILYNSQDVVESVLKEKHTFMGCEVELRRLPEHQIFMSLEGRLNMECSVLLQASQQMRDEMEYVRGIQVRQHKDQTYSLHGHWYQLEWAWRWIDTFMQQQEIIQNSMNTPQAENIEIEEIVEDPPVPRRSISPTRRSSSPSDIMAQLALAESLKESKTRPLSATLGSGSNLGTGARSRNSSTHGNTSSRLGSLEGTYPGNIGGPDSSMHSLKRNIHSQYDGALLGERQYTSLVDYPRDRTDMFSTDLRGSSRHLSDDDLDLIGQPHKVPFESVHSTLGMENRDRRANENSVFEDFSGLRSMQRQQELLKERNEDPESWARAGQSPALPQHSGSSTHSSLDRFNEETSQSARDRYKEEMPLSSMNRYKENSRSSLEMYEDDEDETKLKYTGASRQFDESRTVGQSASYTHTSPRIVSHLPDRYSEDQLSCQFDVRGIKVVVYYGDLTKEETETIVNAANEDLNHTGGVAGALLTTRGYEMQKESNEYIARHGRLNVTEVTHTSGGGGIKAAHILHAAGPIWFDHRAEECAGKIAQTFLNCFRYTNKKLWSKSLALPAISTGVYGAPLDVCVRGFLDALLVFVNSTQRENMRLREVRFVNNDAEATVTSIVLIQTLLEEGIQKLTKEALEMFQKQEEKQESLNIPRGRPEKSDSFTKTFTVTKEPITRSSERNSPVLSSGAKRRSSSLSRVTDKTKSESSRLRDSDDRSRLGLAATERGRERGRTGSFSGSRPTTSRDSTRSTDNNLQITSARTAAKTSKAPPHIKQSMTDTNKLTSFHIKSGTNSSSPSSKASNSAKPKGSSSQRMSATLSARTGSANPRWSSEGTDEEEGGFGMQSLPADYAYQGESYREKFLQMSQHEQKSKRKVEICAICLEDSKDPKQLSKCKHTFCDLCIRRHFKTKPTCPVCGIAYGQIRGNQPRNGTMSHVVKRDVVLPGHEREDGLIMITYSFPPGIQDQSHPNPGKSYKGLTRKAYLPNSVEGREVLRMLKKAFELRLVFTIGQSCTTGATGVLTWNDLHHKTNISGGPTKYGYPDSGYLRRIKDELADKGITKDM